MNKTQKTQRKMILSAMFAALAYASVFALRIDIPPPIPLTFDFKDAIIALGAIILGPVAGVAMAAAVALLELATISGTGAFGLIMNFVSSATFAVVASLIYKYFKNRKGAIGGLITATLVTTAVMIGMNLVVTPLFMGVPVQAVASFILPLFLPFNLTKLLLSSALIVLIYKPLVTALRRNKLIEGKVEKYSVDRWGVVIAVGAVVVIIACLLVFFLHLNGEVTLI